MKLTEVTQRNLATLKEDPQIAKLFETVGSLGSSLILGGAIRDWFHDFLPKDIDIVVDCSTKALDFLKGAKKNSFGGYKVSVSGVDFDIWNLDNSWAMAKDPKLEKKLETIPQTVFFNMDAIAYRLDTGEVMDNGFKAALESKTLDIIYEPNPYPFICVSKSLVMCKKYGLSVSPKLRDYIENQKARGYNQLSFTKYQKLNYGDTIFDYDECMKRVC